MNHELNNSDSSEFTQFSNLHKGQLSSSGVPEIYWDTLNEKIKNQIFNVGETFQLMQIAYEEKKQPHEPTWALQAIKEVKKVDPKHIYLIDHLWTFRVRSAKSQLLQSDTLRKRLCNILGLDDNLSKDELVEVIFANIWKICHTYSLGNAPNIEDCLPVWYVMDEIGSAVMHSNTPNCRIVPFFHIDTQTIYSLLFPINDIDEEFVFVDFAEGINDDSQRSAVLLPWLPHLFQKMCFKPEIPEPSYYLSGHIEETLPNTTHTEKTVKENYKVFTEYSLIQKYLTHNKFQCVDSEDEADILWYTRHFTDYAKLSATSQKLVNQFPFEYVITVKDLLALTCRRSLKFDDDTLESLKWFPITYNLKTEIGNFVNYFQCREAKELENYWIIKPYNLARGLDIHITNNLNYIMRLSLTGSKIVQKYISNPVLFYRPECDGLVKFDIRYMILLQSIKPLKMYTYKQFFLRFANKPFAMKDFEDYETHFTVMNYEENVVMKHMLCSEFKVKWEEQYPLHNWEDIEKSISNILRSVLECAVKEEPPCGIADNPQSRAMYAADLMLEWSENQKIQPKLLEINWTPDCKRACEYYPDFYDDVFRLLFLNESLENFIQL